MQEYIVRHRRVVTLKLLKADKDLLERVRQQMGGDKTDLEVFLRALNILEQYHELQANGGQLLVIFDGNDQEVMEFDFDE